MFYVQYGVGGYKSFIEAAFNCIDYSHLHATIFSIKITRQLLLMYTRELRHGHACFSNLLMPYMNYSEHTTKTQSTYPRTINQTFKDN